MKKAAQKLSINPGIAAAILAAIPMEGQTEFEGGDAMKERIETAVAHIRQVTDFVPEIGLILGSGLGDYAESIENPIRIDYGDIPGFPQSTVEGHAGRFVLGTRKGKRVIAMQGRFHYYEGYSQQEVVLPVRVMRQLGVQKLLLTNAAGGVNLGFSNGTLMLISDHINYSGANPLIGENLDDFGVRFPDMSRVYNAACRDALKQAAFEAGIELREGVYMMFSGPSYETPAEIRMARTVGADAVGMSTVPEAIAARHAGMEIVGISCITNMAAGILDVELSHKDIVETTTRVLSQFVQVLDILLEQVF